MNANNFRVRNAVAADASAIAHVYVASWRSSYKTLLPAGVLRGMNELRETLFWWTALCSPRAGAVSLVVESPDGMVVGFLSGGTERARGEPRRGEIFTLYLLEEYQRRGFGRRLLAAGAARMAELGFTSLVVWVLAGNSARAFYDAAGAVAGPSKTIRVGDRPVQEVAYLWSDIRVAAAAVAATRRDGPLH